MKKLKKKTVAVVITTLSTTTLINNKQVEAHAIPYKNNEVSLSANTPNNNTQFMYLSDMGYMSNLSHTAWGDIKLDQTLEGGTIKLNVDGEALEFNKGITAHATSTVVFDVSHYSNQYSRFTTYVGVDKSQGDRGNGVKFKVLTSVDGQNWEEKFETDVLKGNDHAVFIDIDITGANYLKLYADDNGSNGNDHSVYAAPRIMVPDYDISSEYLQGVKSVSDYDKIIREKYNESHQLTDEIKELVLKRTLTQRVGFYTLQKLIAKSDDHKNTITWLLNHPHVLELYIMGGEIEKSGSYVQSMDVLTQLYHEYKDDFEDPVNGEFYLKLALSLSLSHAQTIRLWTGNGTPSNAVERYKIYKENYLNGRIAEGGDAKLFKNLPIELMRWVTDNKIDDEEINWLIDTALARKVNGKNHLDAYEYIEYTDGYNYNDEKFYLEENYEMWNNKYNISSLTGYGQRGVHKLWMVFEDGSVCGGLAKTYANLGQVFGIPSAGIGQPGHGATLSYRENSNGQGTWVIQNDISGFRESEKGERLLLGWGSKTSKWVSYFNVSYVLLAQHALNHYADYITASYYNLLAKSYESEPTKQEEIYEKALQVQNYNLDTLVGLIETYNKVDSKTSADYLRLAQKVANGLTYFPLPFVDLMNLMDPFMTDDTDKVVFDMLRTTTLQRATQATASDSTQPNECISVAKYLLGDYTTELASL